MEEKKPKLVLVGITEYEEECNLREDSRCLEYYAEGYYGVSLMLSKLKLESSEENIEYYDPQKDEYDYIPASDCDGVDTCWRNYVLEPDIGSKLLIVFQFYDKNIKVMNELASILFGIRVYLFKKQ